MEPTLTIMFCQFSNGHRQRYGFCVHYMLHVEVFYLNSTLNFGIPPVLVFQLEVYYKVDRLLTDLSAQQKGTTAPWYSNKTSLVHKINNTLGTFL